MTNVTNIPIVTIGQNAKLEKGVYASKTRIRRGSNFPMTAKVSPLIPFNFWLNNAGRGCLGFYIFSIISLITQRVKGLTLGVTGGVGL